MGKYSQKEVEEIISSVNTNYEVASEYVNNATPINLRHKPCGGFIKRTLNNFKRNPKCPHCEGGKKSWDAKKVSDYISQATDGDYSLISEYESYNKKITLKHNTCGYEYDVQLFAFKRGNRCPKCGVKKRSESQTKTQSEFCKEVSKATNGLYEVIGEYKGAFRTVKIKHLKCGNVFSKVAKNFLKIPSCPYCGGFRFISDEEFKERVEILGCGEYEVIGNYVSDKKGKVKFKHIKCGHEFEMLASNFTSAGQRCPNCCAGKSKGELIIRDVLKSLDVDFEEQYKFDDCSDKQQLRFDFAIFKNDKLEALIEFDGIQHYRGWQKDKEDLRDIKRRDKIKDDYCLKHNLKLVRIPYFKMKNIEEIIKEVVL